MTEKTLTNRLTSLIILSIDIFINGIKKIKMKIKFFFDKRKLFSSILTEAEKGTLTKIERNQILIRCEELNLVLEDLKKVRGKVFDTAFNALKQKNFVTFDEEMELNEIQKFLMIPDSEIVESKEDLGRIRILTEIKNGTPPSQSSANVILKKNETIYWQENVSLLEVRVTGRSYQGGSRGVSLRLAKGISFRVGNKRGSQVSEKGIVSVASGNFIITNKRIMFNSIEKSFDIRLDKIMGLNFADDGIVFNTSNRQKPYIIELINPKNAEIIEATLSFAIKNFVI